MKRFMFFVGAIFFTAGVLRAGKTPYKYGNVPKEELEMSFFPDDSAAVAAYMYEEGTVWFDYNRDHFQLCYEHKARIKIFSADGTTYGDVSIPYYSSTTGKEYITGLEAVAWNLENGKAVKTKLSRDYIFDERVDENRYRKKFSVPGVKAGTVIEYKYRIISDFYYNLPNWNFQHDIPVKYSRFETLIPEYFYFNTSMTGYLHIQTETVNEGQNFSVDVGSGRMEWVQCVSKKAFYVAENIPAMIPEPYVWCTNDFVSGIRYELQGVKFPYSTYRPYSRSWTDVEDLLKNSDKFGRKLQMGNPFKHEIELIAALPVESKDKLRAVFRFIQESFKWNGRYGFFEDDIKETLKTRTGTNADINFILISALKDAGFQSFPVLMSRRTKGRLPLTYASIENLNTFVVGVDCGEEGLCFLDASDPYTDVNVLPTQMIVNRARRYGAEAGKEPWIDLCEALDRNQVGSLIKAEIDGEGRLTGSCRSSFINQQAYLYKRKYYGFDTPEEYRESLHLQHEITVDSFSVSGVDTLSSRLQEYFSFGKVLETSGDYIYLNPLLFPLFKENPFTSPERQLPVEFDVPYTYKASVIIDLPEGYQVEEIPSSTSIAMQGKEGRSVYRIQLTEDRKIMVNYLYELKNVIFPVTEYEMIRQYFGNVVTQNAGQVVLKKVRL